MEQGTEFVMCYGSDVTGKTLCPDDPWSDYVSVWHMESTNPVDHAAGNNNGTGTAGLSVVDGISGSAVSFPGASNEGVSCGTNLSNANLVRGFTFQSWVNFSVYSDTQYGRAFFGKDKFISIRSKHRDNFVITTPGIKDHEFKINSQEDYLGNVGVWNHIVISFMPGSSGAKIYLNGKLILSQSASDFSDKTNPTEMWLGRNQWGGQEFKGIMDEARLSKSILSAETIAATYAAQMPETFLTIGMLEKFESDESEASPVFRAGVEEISYTELTVNVSCLAIGDGATSVNAEVQISSDEDFNSIVDTKQLAFNSLGLEVIVLSDLMPATTYFIRVVSVNDKSIEGIPISFSCATHSPAPVFTAYLEYYHIYPEISLSFQRLGMADKVNKITILSSPTGDFTNPTQSNTFEVDITTAPTDVDGFVLTNIPSSTTQYFRVIAYNDKGFSSFVDLNKEMEDINENNVWSGLSEDISDTNAYVFEGGLPEPGKILYFTNPAGMSPVINENTVMPSLRFTANTGTSVDANYYDGYHSCGYDFTGTGVLTFNAEKPIVQASKGTNVVWNPILFNRANDQTAYISSVGGRLDIMGELMLPEGVSNTTLRVNGEGGEVHFGGPSPDFMGTLYLESSFTLYLDNPHSVTNMNKIFFGGGWGSYTHLKNNTGDKMIFPRCTSVETTTDWSSARVNFEGAPFVFPNATLKWCPRETTQSTLDADVFVKNLIVGKNNQSGAAVLDKTGYGALIVTDTTQWDANNCKHLIRLQRGCFAPMTDAAMPPSGEFYVNKDHVWRNTIGLTRDHTPMLDGSSFPRVFQTSSWACWGFTGFGGDRTVCWNNDPSLNMTNTTSGTVSTRIADSVTTNVYGETYDSYYAYPPYFMFGNRSEFADGTIIFMNPIRYELGQNWDSMTVFESTNHVVAARLRGSIKQGTTNKTWKFSGNNFGGYLALEADNSDFTGKISVYEKGNLLVNSPLVAQEVTVQSGSGLGGTGNMATAGGTTIKSGAALFGGEWNKGGTLTIGGKLTFEANSAIRAEVCSSNDRVGYIKLAPESVLKLSGPVYVDVDTDTSISPVRGTGIKILDWSEATFDSGIAPTVENFVPRVESNSDISKIYLSTKEDGLYMGYVTGRVPDGVFIFIK